MLIRHASHDRSDIECWRPRPRALWLGWLVLFATGCGQDWRPTPVGSEHVRGRIVVNGAPVRSGWVEFIPIDGAIGTVRSAPLQSDGTFLATRVARGKNVIRIVDPPESSGVYRLFQSFQSPIRPIVRGEKPLELDLERPSTWQVPRVTDSHADEEKTPRPHG